METTPRIKQIIPITHPLFALFISCNENGSRHHDCRPCHCLALVDWVRADDWLARQSVEGLILDNDRGLVIPEDDECFQGYFKSISDAASEFSFPE